MLQVSTAGRSLKELLEEYERTLIVAALETTGGHQRRAAEILGVLPTTFHEIPPYRHNPISGSRFLEKDLQTPV